MQQFRLNFVELYCIHNLVCVCVCAWAEFLNPDLLLMLK